MSLTVQLEYVFCEKLVNYIERNYLKNRRVQRVQEREEKWKPFWKYKRSKRKRRVELAGLEWSKNLEQYLEDYSE